MIRQNIVAMISRVLQRHLDLYLRHANEELAAVRSGPRVGHTQNTRPSVLQSEVFVLELGAVDRRPTGAVRIVEIATLVSRRSTSAGTGDEEKNYFL